MTVGELVQRLRYYDINTEIVFQDPNNRQYGIGRLETALQETVVEPVYGEPPIVATKTQLVFVAKEGK